MEKKGTKFIGLNMKLGMAKELERRAASLVQEPRRQTAQATASLRAEARADPELGPLVERIEAAGS